MASATNLPDVDLLPGEVPLKKWFASTAAWGPFLGSGDLYLTNRRLVWLKADWNIFPILHEIVIDLDSIECCRTLFFSRYYVRLKLRDGQKKTFLIHWGISGKEVASDINSVLQERHATHA